MPGPRSRRSRLLPLGFVLMVVGITFPRALSMVARGLEPGPLRAGVNWLSGLLYAGVLVGLVAAVVGIRRNRRWYRS